MLKGMWLKELGFDIGDYISVTCEDGRLVITPDAERAAVKAEEAEYMEREKACQSQRTASEIWPYNYINLQAVMPKPVFRAVIWFRNQYGAEYGSCRWRRCRGYCDPCLYRR